jgi:ribonuclease E
VVAPAVVKPAEPDGGQRREGRGDRGERGDRGGRGGRGGRDGGRDASATGKEGGRGGRDGRPGDRPAGERAERAERPDRGDRPPQDAGAERPPREGRGEGRGGRRNERGDRAERPVEATEAMRADVAVANDASAPRAERGERAEGRGDRGERGEGRGDRGPRGPRPEREPRRASAPVEGEAGTDELVLAQAEAGETQPGGEGAEGGFEGSTDANGERQSANRRRRRRGGRDRDDTREGELAATDAEGAVEPASVQPDASSTDGQSFDGGRTAAAFEGAAPAESLGSTDASIEANGTGPAAEGGEVGRDGRRRRGGRGGSRRDRGEGVGAVAEGGDFANSEPFSGGASAGGNAAVPPYESAQPSDRPVAAYQPQPQPQPQPSDGPLSDNRSAPEAVARASHEPQPSSVATPAAPADSTVAGPADPLPVDAPEARMLERVSPAANDELPADVAAPTPIPPAAAPAAAGSAPCVLPTDELQKVAQSAGLEWVNSDAEKISIAQQAIAAEVPAPRVPRQPKPVVAIDEGPLVLVETRKNLGDVKLPFEQQSPAN